MNHHLSWYLASTIFTERSSKTKFDESFTPTFNMLLLQCCKIDLGVLVVGGPATMLHRQSICKTLSVLITEMLMSSVACICLKTYRNLPQFCIL